MLKDLIKDLVSRQHSSLPLHPRLFRRLLATRTGFRAVRAYALHCAMTDYRSRAGNADYWLSDKSIYWHLAREHDIDFGLLDTLAQWAEGRELLMAASVIVEPGYGLGKMTTALLQRGYLAPRRLVGLERCEIVRRYAEKRRPRQVELRDGDLLDLPSERFDTLLLNGGVLMFYDPETLRGVFRNLKVERLIVLYEGAPQTIARDDGTWMHGLPELASLCGLTRTISTGCPIYQIFLATKPVP